MTEKDKKNKPGCLGCLLVLGIFVVGMGVSIWAYTSPSLEKYQLLRDRDTEEDLSIAFTVALFTNDREAYEIADQGLVARLDEWMGTHQARNCKYKAYIILTACRERDSGQIGCHTLFGCLLGDSTLPDALEICDVVIEDMKVVDWEQVDED